MDKIKQQNVDQHSLYCHPFSVLRKWWYQRRKRKLITRLRAESAFWGLKMDDLSDEEIEEGLMRITNMLRKVGISSEEAAHGFRVIMRCLNE